jgi:hypothetical protein
MIVAYRFLCLPLFVVGGNVIVGEADQYGKRIRISARLLRFRSTTRYDYTIALTFGCILLDTFLFFLLDSGSRNFRLSPFLYLSLRRLRFRFFDYFEDFLRIKDELSFNSYALPFLTLSTYS